MLLIVHERYVLIYLVSQTFPYSIDNHLALKVWNNSNHLEP